MFAEFHRHFYRHWLASERAPAWVKVVIPEPETTDESFNCGRCFMIRPKGLTRDLGPFDAELKCCTFHPFLPNFTVGALSLEVDEGRLSPESFNQFLNESRLTVIGAFSLKAATSICETGKKPSDRCPFLANGRCSIHAFRPSTCSSYVCRSKNGEAGIRSWRIFEERLAKFEWSMAHEAAYEIGFTKRELDITYASREDAVSDYRRTLGVARLTSVSDWDE